MTVSLSLRNHPSIPEATRERIKAIAEKNGYKPDPMVGRLMRHLRAGPRQRQGAMICALGMRFSHKKRGYAEDILEGAKARAAELGFFLDKIWLDETGMDPARLKRLLRSRGVEALLLLPMAEPLDLTNILEWANVSAVATSATVTAPHVHMVLPAQFGNTLALCEALRAEGALRIGLVTVRAQDKRVEHRVAAAVAWHNLEHGCPEVTPLLLDSWEVDKTAFRDWYSRTNPDAIIADVQAYLDVMRELLPARNRAKIRFACTTLPHGEPMRHAGIEEDARSIGATAIEQLDWMYQHGERGIPAKPRVTLITGRYLPAPRTPAKAVAPNTTARKS